jgi:hypothetical protein
VVADGRREELGGRILLSGGSGRGVDDEAGSFEREARRLPVITSTPCRREMGTTSYPRSVSTSATWCPTRPAAPATAILIGSGMTAPWTDLSRRVFVG